MTRTLKSLIGGLVVGLVGLGGALAGTILAPPQPMDLVISKQVPAGMSTDDEATPPAEPGPGEILAGAAAVSIAPAPGPGEVWAKEGCATLGEDAPQAPSHVPDFRSTWPENPNCIYMGGYGIGPMNPITSVDQTYGLWVRSAALSDGEDTVVLALIDGTSYFGRYAKMCQGCGAFDLAASLGQELGLPASSFFIGSTHSHTAPDFIGGWGGVPQWYMDQVTAAIENSVRESVASMQPAVLEAGEQLGRRFNGERRDTYRSAEDQFLTWFRALEVDEEHELTGRAVVTVGAFAAHPTNVDEGTGIGDADYHGVFAKRVEERFGGVGMIFPTGLGNMSSRGNKTQMGEGLASLLPEPGDGPVVQGTDVKTVQTFWDQPVTNSGLTALGTPGFFDRPFSQSGATVTAGKSANKPCRSASPVSVRTAVSSAKAGALRITGAPGEVFSNLTNTLKERANGVVMPLGQINDGLGYIMQSFETDHAARQVLGFAGGGVFEYEDAYSIDGCFGDMVLETTISQLAGL